METLVTSPYAPVDGTGTPDSYVRARVTIAVRTFFGRVIGKRVITITRQAVAEAAPGNQVIFARTTAAAPRRVLEQWSMLIEGGIWSNGAFKANGHDIKADSAEVGGPSGCPPSPPMSGCTNSVRRQSESDDAQQQCSVARLVRRGLIRLHGGEH